MPERVLRKVMADFVSSRIDVLACTTIIESGLDIPNANTIIISERSEAYGLAGIYCRLLRETVRGLKEKLEKRREV